MMIISIISDHFLKEHLTLIRGVWVHGDLIECSSIKAALMEMEERLRPKSVELLSPELGDYLFHDGLAAQDHGGEAEKYKRGLLAKAHIFIAVHSQGPPRHYTYLHISKQSKMPPVWACTYKDSLNTASPENFKVAQTILKNLGLQELAENLVVANKDFQRDGWSCGLWTLKWIERELRRIGGEARTPDLSIPALLARANQTIKRINQAATPKAKAKAKAAPKSEAARKVPKAEPQFETLEQALDAALDCVKCVPTMIGTNIDETSNYLLLLINYFLLCCKISYMINSIR